MEGVDKLLEPVDGVPLLLRSARTCVQSQGKNVVVVLRHPDAERRAALSGLNVQVIENPDWESGMATSLHVGLSEVNNSARAIVITLADMPEITPHDIDALIAEFDPDNGITICQAVDENNLPGHPVLFGRDHFDELSSLTGDTGARSVLAKNQASISQVMTGGHNSKIDLDTPADWAAYRSWKRQS